MTSTELILIAIAGILIGFLIALERCVEPLRFRKK
jgi:hypothetical protein